MFFFLNNNIILRYGERCLCLRKESMQTHSNTSNMCIKCVFSYTVSQSFLVISLRFEKRKFLSKRNKKNRFSRACI